MPRGTGMSKTRRRRGIRPDRGVTVERLRSLLTAHAADTRTNAEYLRDMKAKQAAGRLANPATAALLDRLERAI